MKFRLLLLVMIFGLSQSYAQSQPAALPASKDFPTFELEKADKSTFHSTQVKKNIPTAIIFFSPTCEHCQHQIEAMMKRTRDLKKYQFVWATYQPVDELVAFNKKYAIARNPNFVTGRDSKYFFPPFYQIHNFPFLAFYDKNGKLITTFEGNISVDDMLKKFNKRI